MIIVLLLNFGLLSGYFFKEKILKYLHKYVCFKPFWLLIFVTNLFASLAKGFVTKINNQKGLKHTYLWRYFLFPAEKR